MARGWESKSIESQMEQAVQSKQLEEQRLHLASEQIQRERERESLLLSRTRVLHEIEASTHPRYRQQLEAALAHLDRQLKKLEPVAGSAPSVKA
jgi:hypothetical protein